MNLQTQKEKGAVSLEYPKVLKTVKNAEWLLYFHRQKIDSTKICAIIKAVWADFGITFAVKFKRGTGNCFACRNLRTGKIHLSLCYQDSTVGTVLHEIAHVFNFHGSNDSHGPGFCANLDKLIVWYHQKFLVK